MYCIPGYSHTMGDITMDNNHFFHEERNVRMITGFFNLMGPLNATLSNNRINAFIEGDVDVLVRFYIFSFLCNPNDNVPVYHNIINNTVWYDSGNIFGNAALSPKSDGRFIREVHMRIEGNIFEGIRSMNSFI